MPDENEIDDEWGLVVDFRLDKLDKDTRTLKMGVLVGIGAGVAGIGMSLILGKTVAKMAEGLGQLSQFTQALMVQANGGTVAGPTGAPGPDVPPPTNDGAARAIIDPRALDETRKPPNGSKVSEPFEGPASEVSDAVREILEQERVEFNEPTPEAGTAVILDDDDIKPVGG
jgi:F0F1-type ATP synthase membrane subunit c/vacuolar-type H+-ATPase subunit K